MLLPVFLKGALGPSVAGRQAQRQHFLLIEGWMGGMSIGPKVLIVGVGYYLLLPQKAEAGFLYRMVGVPYGRQARRLSSLVLASKRRLETKIQN